MSQRTARVNQLLRLEISEYLHRRYTEEAVAITISEVDASPDYRSARVFYSVIGDEKARSKARSLFERYGKDIQQQVARKVILKYFPKLEFRFDDSMERGARIIAALDALDDDSETPSPAS